MSQIALDMPDPLSSQTSCPTHDESADRPFEAIASFFRLNVSSKPFSLGVANKQRYVWLLKITSLCLVILSLTWLTVNLSVPGLKKRDLLGSELWKWTLLVMLVLCGYNIISVATGFFLYILLLNKKIKGKKAAEYYARGLRRSVNLVAHAGAILLTWIFYFRRSRGIIRKPHDREEVILNVDGTWTLVTLTTAASLCLLKNLVLLKWEADAVYSRFAERISNAGVQLYFVSRICNPHWNILIHPRSHVEDEETCEEENENKANEREENETKAKEEMPMAREMNQARNILFINKDATTYRIKQMAKYFVDLSKVFTKEDDETSHVSEQCRKIFPSYHITKEDIKSKLEEKDADYLYKKLEEVYESRRLRCSDLEDWMVKAHRKCVALGRTLSDATEVVKVLDKVLTSFLFGIAIIAWLLLTDIASTKILILIASPLLATVFVFGDTCKKIFEGIIFSFITHPFDVGDRCIIDKTELEVKRMSIMATTFILNGTKDEALYPNSALAMMTIIKRKEEDPEPKDDRDDEVELALDSSFKPPDMLRSLKSQIERFFDEKGRGTYDKATISTDIGDQGVLKLVIRFQHVMDVYKMTHSQCLEEKKRQRTELLLTITQLAEAVKIWEEESMHRARARAEVTAYWPSPQAQFV